MSEFQRIMRTASLQGPLTYRGDYPQDVFPRFVEFLRQNAH